MMRTQIQLPDHVYAEAKRIAQEHEISLAEVVRRGLERMIALYPPGRNTDWDLPAARALGRFKAPVEQWRELANTR
jgi:hypothetical protein